MSTVYFGPLGQELSWPSSVASLGQHEMDTGVM